MWNRKRGNGHESKYSTGGQILPDDRGGSILFQRRCQAPYLPAGLSRGCGSSADGWGKAIGEEKENGEFPGQGGSNLVNLEPQHGIIYLLLRLFLHRRSG